MHIDGQCHCGHVRYEAEIDPSRVSICHCTDCQRLTGSAFRVTAITPTANVRLTANRRRSIANMATTAGRGCRASARNAARRCSRDR